MARYHRTRLVEALGAECCHPDCYAPALVDIATQVPLCERHVMTAYRLTHKMMASNRAMDQAYELLPMEAEFIPGPCPACGTTGLLVELANAIVTCKAASCAYEQDRFRFGNERKILMGISAGRQSVVYYMRLGNRAKIGHTANLKQRMSAIQPEDCMTYELGGTQLEGRRHRQFAHLRVSGEWFDLQGELIRHVNTLQVSA